MNTPHAGKSLRGRAAPFLCHLPVLLLSGFYLYACGSKAARQPLWFDEIISYYVASLDGPRTIIEALLGRMDNHPPLDYLLRHGSMALLGHSEFAFRLPSVIALLTAVLALYLFALRRTAVMPALAAFSLPLTTLALKYGYEGRGYALLMASMCLSLLAWQLAYERPTAARLAFLAVALCLGPFSHYYGVLNYVPIAAGEAWRSRQQRRVSWPIVGCLTVSLASAGLLIPLAINAAEFSDAFWIKLAPARLFYGYIDILEPAIPWLLACLLIYAGLALLPARRGPLAIAKPSFPGHELIAAAVMLLLPFTTYLMAELLTRAYISRALLNLVFGFALLTANAVHHLTYWRKSAAVFVTVAIAGWASVLLIYLPLTVPASPAVADSEKRFIADAKLPIVVANGHEFLKLQRYLPPALREKIFYLADPQLALRYAGTDTNDRALTNLSSFVPMNVAALCAFTSKNLRFLLLTGAQWWITEKFLEENAAIAMLASRADGQMVFSVTLPKPIGCR